MENRKISLKARNYILVISLFIAGMLILALRNPDPFINPIVYAEDGSWVGMGLLQGWLYTLIHARNDYFVILDIVFLFLATKLSVLFSGNPLTFLPESIAIISLAFFSGVATFAFAITKNIMPNLFRFIVYLLLLLIPLGTTENEIIGRILQIGYYMPFIAALLFFLRSNLRKAYKIFIVDLLIILCAATNPVVFPVGFLYLMWDLIKDKDHKLKDWLKRNLTLIIPLGVLLIFLIPRMLGDMPLSQGKFEIINFIETFIARPVLYPFLFPFYKHLSNITTISIFIIWLYVILASFKLTKNLSPKRLMLFLAITLFVYDVATIVMRVKLTSWLNLYHSVGPSRYFMGLNILSLTLFMIALAQMVSVGNNIHKKFGYALLSLILLIYAWQLPSLFEISHSKMPIKTYFNFSEKICLSTKEPDNRTSRIQIYPEIPPSVWYMLVPNKFIDKSHCKNINIDDITDTSNSYEIKPSKELHASIDIITTSSHQNEKSALKRIGILFGLYGKKHSGDAELYLKGSTGTFSQRFSLSSLDENQYHYVDIDLKHYTSGKIISLTGSGISAWESHDKNGALHTCIIYEYSNGRRRITPGCPLY